MARGALLSTEDGRKPSEVKYNRQTMLNDFEDEIKIPVSTKSRHLPTDSKQDKKQSKWSELI